MSYPANLFDVAIVGAGPAGTQLAYHLAQAGCSVVLFDPRVPWEKPCGGAVTELAYARLPAIRQLRHNAIDNSLQVAWSGRCFVIDEGHPVLMVSRRDLSSLMLARAQRAGVQHVAQAVTRITVRAGVVHLQTQPHGQQYRSQLVVGADGVRSLVRRYFLGRLPRARCLAAISQVYEGGPADPTLIRSTPFPGYAWAFAHHDGLYVGAGAMRPGPNQLKHQLRIFMQHFFPQRRPCTALRGALLPYMNDLRALAEPRVGPCWALVGDAAGFSDTLTGEGIVYALWSADLLAQAYLAGKLPEYDKQWRRAFGWHLFSGALIARYLFTPKGVDYFFTALNVCPTARRIFLKFVWQRPSYLNLYTRLLLAYPRIFIQWRRFVRQGGHIPAASLGVFQPLAPKLDLQWSPVKS